MTSKVPEHERLFDEICGKLHELSRNARVPGEDSMQSQEKMDRLQTQLRRFQSDLQDTQVELREKIKSLENVQVVQSSDMHQQLKQVTEQLNNERAVNTKLNQDLARSLELGLQLQLEIQNLKTRAQQSQNEERKFNQTLQEKIRQLGHDLELSRALREETETEFGKARGRYANDQDGWNKERADWQAKLDQALGERKEADRQRELLQATLSTKEEEIRSLHQEIENMEGTFKELEEGSVRQHDALRQLSEVAENKIVELKVALDRKAAECRDYEGHLQQALTQNQLIRQENNNLKEHITKMNAYLQSPASAPALPVPAERV